MGQPKKHRYGIGLSQIDFSYSKECANSLWSFPDKQPHPLERKLEHST